MQDSQITITVTAVDGATKVFEGVGDAAVKQASRAASAWQKANDVSNVSIESAGGAADATNKASAAQDNLAASTRRSYFAQTALTTILSAGINKAFLTMVDVTGQAIKRVDLISNFPKTMESLGVSANDASVSLSKLSAYVSTVGGNLQDATSTVTRFTETTKNVKAATAEFEGVNNALIAGGGSAQDQANALEQLTQAYSRGVPQLTEWRSLMVAMPAQLSAVAKAMNLPNAQALGESLTKGKTSMQDFLTELTKLGTGTGSIAQQANAHLSGIQFGFNQFKNALVTGMTEIIQAIGRQNITDFFSLLTSTVKQLAEWAVKLIGILLNLFNVVSQVFGGPTLKLASDNTAGIADNLGTSADNAGTLADNLNNANKAAAASLASFDKMNVLTQPTTKPSPSSGGLSAADAAALNGIFNDMNAQLQKVTGAAKILAAIIASLIGIKFAQGILNQLNGLFDTIEKTQTNFNKLKTSILGGTDESGKKIDGLVQKLGGLGKTIGGVGSNLASSIIGGITTVFAQSASKVFSPLVDGAIAAGGAIIQALAFVGAVVAEILLLPEELALGVLVAIGVAVVAAVVAIGVLITKNWNTIWNTIKTIFLGFWNWLTTLWSGITGFFSKVWDGVVAVFNAVVTFLKKWGEDILVTLLSPFIFGTAIIIVVVGALVGFFEGLIKDIVTIVSAVVGFFIGIFTDAWNGIVAVWNIVADWFNTNVWQPIMTFFAPVATFFGKIFTDAWNAVTVVWGAVSGWFNTSVWIPIVNIFSGVGAWFGARFSEAWTNIKNSFSAVASWFDTNVWQPIVSLFTRVGTSIGDAISGAFKAVVNTVLKGAIGIFNDFLGLLRGAVNIINDAHIPGVHISTSGIQPIPVPQLATGGVVGQPTLAIVGEAGKEAIMPLENNTGWIDKLASKINSANGGGNGQPINLTVQIGEDKIANKIINLINEKTQMSGRNTILV